MNMVIQAIAEYGLLAAGLILCTFLFITLKQDLHRMGRRSRERQQALTSSIEQLGAELNAMKLALAEIERKTGELPQLSPPRPGMNTTRRSQVLRMHRRGETPEQIAAALGLPQGEVDLLLKVHQLSRPA